MAIRMRRNVAPIWDSARIRKRPKTKNSWRRLGSQESSASKKVYRAGYGELHRLRNQFQSSTLPHCRNANLAAFSIASNGDSKVFPWPTERLVGFKRLSFSALSAARKLFQEKMRGNGK